MHLRTIFLLLILLSFPGTALKAQEDVVPMQADLARNADQWLLKIGMINKKKPPKLKFGTYTTEERDGNTASRPLRFSGDPELDLSLEFRFALINKEKDSVYVEAYSEPGMSSGEKDFSIYMASSAYPEDLWILMLSTTPDSKDLSVSTMIMTNGTEEISFKNLVGTPKGKSEQSAPRGLEIFQENLSIGALQYDSGATFGYRKYIWINRQADKQMQLLAASVFSAILEVSGYFEQARITD